MFIYIRCMVFHKGKFICKRRTQLDVKAEYQIYLIDFLKFILKVRNIANMELMTRLHEKNHTINDM